MGWSLRLYISNENLSGLWISLYWQVCKRCSWSTHILQSAPMVINLTDDNCQQLWLCAWGLSLTAGAPWVRQRAEQKCQGGSTLRTSISQWVVRAGEGILSPWLNISEMFFIGSPRPSGTRFPIPTDDLLASAFAVRFPSFSVSLPLSTGLPPGARPQQTTCNYTIILRAAFRGNRLKSGP
jgi:hypothetical protein